MELASRVLRGESLQAYYYWWLLAYSKHEYLKEKTEGVERKKVKDVCGVKTEKTKFLQWLGRGGSGGFCLFGVFLALYLV